MTAISLNRILTGKSHTQTNIHISSKIPISTYVDKLWSQWVILHKNQTSFGLFQANNYALKIRSPSTLWTRSCKAHRIKNRCKNSQWNFYWKENWDLWLGHLVKLNEDFMWVFKVHSKCKSYWRFFFFPFLFFLYVFFLFNILVSVNEEEPDHELS